jgi:Cytochrome c
MNCKYLFVIIGSLSFFAISCNSNTQPDKQAEKNNGNTSNKKDSTFLTEENKSKGIGKFTNVQLTHPLDKDMVAKGEPIYNGKCFACHKLTDEKLVGPGWKSVTDRRTPEWIMNFITNTNVMLDSDLVAQSVMVTCLVRMPNQNLSDVEARQILEFMRKNDGKN